jgi:16S rRNA (cytidine1402-2'-O)-methyltransferase
MLYLFPNLLADLDMHAGCLPASVDVAVAEITTLIAENEKEGRRFLRRFFFPPPKTFREIPILLLNEHSTEKDKKELLQEMQKGGVWGLISDCGMPCLADPGADLVLMARQKGIAVKTFAGPSSILLALVLSGLGGQHFTFHGYLPKEEAQLIQELRRIEKLSLKEKSTHLFIETPYRNLKMLEKILATLDDNTWLCIACALTTDTEDVQTHKIGAWKKKAPPVIDRRPTVFAIRTSVPLSNACHSQSSSYPPASTSHR